MGFFGLSVVEAAEAIWLPRSLISVWVSGVPRPAHEMIALELTPDLPVGIDADLDRVVPLYRCAEAISEASR